MPILTGCAEMQQDEKQANNIRKSYETAKKITTKSEMKNIAKRDGDYLIQGKVTTDKPFEINGNKYMILDTEYLEEKQSRKNK